MGDILFWSLLPTLCRCGGLLLHVVTHNDTHTHIGKNPWMRVWNVAEISPWQNANFPRNQHPFTRRNSNPQSQQPREAGLRLRLRDYRSRHCWWLGDWELSSMRQSHWGLILTRNFIKICPAIKRALGYYRHSFGDSSILFWKGGKIFEDGNINVYHFSKLDAIYCWWT